MKYLLWIALGFVPMLSFARVMPAAQSQATLQVSAQATVSRAPDRVYIDVGIRTQAPRPQDAAAENAARGAAVIAAVRRVAGPTVQLTTINYSVNPQYQYQTNGRPPILTGYAVTNLLQVRLDQLARIGPVIDAAIAAGANVQQDLRFALRDPETARLSALAQAARRAHQAANALATSLGLRIVRILSVVQTGGAVVPPIPRMVPQVLRAERMAPATPIESGGIRISASVNLTVAVAPR